MTFDIDHHEILESTQDEVLRTLRTSGASLVRPVLVTADHQRAGRGRAGRTWTSSPGRSLLASVGLPGPYDLAVLDERSLRCAQVVQSVVTDVSGIDAHSIVVDPPNDLVAVGGAKLGGILVDAASVNGIVAWIAVGVGINVVGPVAVAGGRPGVALDELGWSPVEDLAGFRAGLALGIADALARDLERYRVSLG